MNMITNGLRSVARDRAELTRDVVLIRDEVMESVIDDLIFSDELNVVKESSFEDDDIDLMDAFREEIEDIDEDELIDALGDNDEYHDAEIERILKIEPGKSINADDFLLNDEDDVEDITDEEIDELV